MHIKKDVILKYDELKGMIFYFLTASQSTTGFASWKEECDMLSTPAAIPIS
jgi:hypothetical protein